MTKLQFSPNQIKPGKKNELGQKLSNFNLIYTFRVNISNETTLPSKPQKYSSFVVVGLGKLKQFGVL